jgi:hypothetical protein
MKKKTFSKLIQGPLRFHHQDIHEELSEIKNDIDLIKTILLQILHDEKFENTSSIPRGQE